MDYIKADDITEFEYLESYNNTDYDIMTNHGMLRIQKDVNSELSIPSESEAHLNSANFDYINDRIDFDGSDFKYTLFLREIKKQIPIFSDAKV